MRKVVQKEIVSVARLGPHSVGARVHSSVVTSAVAMVVPSADALERRLVAKSGGKMVVPMVVQMAAQTVHRMAALRVVQMVERKAGWSADLKAVASVGCLVGC